MEAVRRRRRRSGSWRRGTDIERVQIAEMRQNYADVVRATMSMGLQIEYVRVFKLLSKLLAQY